MGSSPMLDHVNACWGLNLDNNHWKKMLSLVWHYTMELEKACFRWIVLLQKLPIKTKSNDVEMCSICRVPDSVRHILFDCLYAQEIWRLFCHRFKVWNTNGKILWKKVLFMNSKINKDCNLLWYWLTNEIMWHVWKVRNENKFIGSKRELTDFHIKLTLLNVAIQVSVHIATSLGKFLCLV